MRSSSASSVRFIGNAVSGPLASRRFRTWCVLWRLGNMATPQEPSLHTRRSRNSSTPAPRASGCVALLRAQNLRQLASPYFGELPIVVAQSGVVLDEALDLRAEVANEQAHV